MVVYERDINQITKEFAVEIIKFVNYLKLQKNDFPLRDQLLRSGTSIGANVCEAKASSSRREYIRYYEIALRSSNETHYWIEIINEIYHFEERTNLLVDKLNHIRKIIASIIIILKVSLNAK